MAAVSTRPTQATQASIPPLNMSGENDRRSHRIIQITIPIIIALASFLFLPMEIAFVVTAAATIGTIVYNARIFKQVPTSSVVSKPEPTSLPCPIGITAKRVVLNQRTGDSACFMWVKFQNATAEEQFRKTFAQCSDEFGVEEELGFFEKDWFSPNTTRIMPEKRQECERSIVRENRNAVILAHLEKLYGKATIESLVKNERQRFLSL